MNIPYFDAHCDTLTTCLDNGWNLFNSPGHISLQKAGGFSKYSQILAIFIDDETRGEAAVQRFLEVYEFGKKQLSFCTGQSDYKNAGKNRFFLSMEGGQGLGGKLENVERFYNLGLRMITLTWNGDNELASGCFGTKCGGLTPFGKEVIDEMNRLSMVVDVSHLNETGFWEVMERADHVMCSHSDAKKVCDHPRNITDEQFFALMQKKGGTGLNLYPNFIGGNGSFDAIIRQIEYFWELGGEDALFLGADFDGIDVTPPDIPDMTGMARLYEELKKRGAGEELLNKLFYNNLERIFVTSLEE